MTKNLKHHEFTAEWIEDEDGPAVMLAQSDGWGGEDNHSVILHPHQLRAVCEQFGIVAADQEAAKTIATLQRRMLAMRGRIDRLNDWMAQLGDHRRADLAHEMASVEALAELAREWCADFEAGSGITCVRPSDVSDVAGKESAHGHQGELQGF